MRPALFCLALCVGLGLPAQDLSGLPPWAREAAAAGLKEAPPKEADAWVLLKRTEYAYDGRGVLLRHHFRLVRILGQRGLEEGSYALLQSGGRLHEIRRLKGWNLRPDGELLKLSRSNVQVLDSDDQDTVTTETVKVAALDRVDVGSLVAFESEEAFSLPFGPFALERVLEAFPVRRWELLSKPDSDAPAATLEPRHWQAWGLSPMPLEGSGRCAANLPALPSHESRHPYLANLLPMVLVHVADPAAQAGDPLTSWDRFASWTCARFLEAAKPSGQLPAQGAGARAALSGILDWMDRQLIYHAVYLTPDRGWLPLACAEVVRRRSGDCKDLAACLLGEAAGAGLEGYPVLCSIQEQDVEADSSPNPFTFNHAIAALKLKESLGLPAEVQTAQGRFLLVDATDRYCPFGRLPSAHRQGQVLICTPGGALWAKVPPGAPMVPELHVEVTGEAAAGGRTRARVRLVETANAHDLRMLAHEGGQNLLTERTLRALFHLPATGTLTDFTMGDPQDLEHPFEVAFTVTRTGGFTAGGGRCHLEPWGLPEPLPAIQRPDTPRRYPVEARDVDLLDYHAAWTFPVPVNPSLPALDAVTPFADLTWRAAAEGGKVALDFHLRRKAARFDGDQREAGVAAWRKFRGLLNQVREDGTTFRVKAE